MLENARAEKRRRHPDGSERRNVLKNNRRLRCDKDRRCVRLLRFTGRDERDRALVIRSPGIGMKPCVQLRRSREREGEEKGRKQTTRNNGAEFEAEAHGEQKVGIESKSTQAVST